MFCSKCGGHMEAYGTGLRCWKCGWVYHQQSNSLNKIALSGQGLRPAELYKQQLANQVVK